MAVEHILVGGPDKGQTYVYDDKIPHWHGLMIHYETAGWFLYRNRGGTIDGKVILEGEQVEHGNIYKTG